MVTGIACLAVAALGVLWIQNGKSLTDDILGGAVALMALIRLMMGV